MIYLDYNASTPVDPIVAAAMRPFLDEAFGNPSSGHWASVPAKRALENARGQVASLLRCAAEEVVFTSGGSEANNLAIKGTFFALKDRGEHLVTTQIEHPAVLGPCRFLERLGANVTYLPVDRYGRVDPDDIRRAVTSRTILITVMHANNEVGTIQPLAEIGAIAREHGIRLHTDAAQSLGKIPVHVDELGVDLLTVVGHKFHAPKGVGALYVRRNVTLEPLIHGGGHERGLRSGTESALLTVGLGAACALAMDLQPMERIRALRDRLWHGLRQIFGDAVVVNGHPELRLPNTLNVSFVARVGAEVLARLDGVAASTGSACHSGRVELSPVLSAMNVPERVGMGAVRFSLGRATSETEIEFVLQRLRDAKA